MRATGDVLGQHWAFTGRFFDEETREYYYRARMYSAEAGRFMQRDPLGVQTSPSLYEYAYSSPILHIDPTGMEPWNNLPNGIKNSGGLRAIQRNFDLCCHLGRQACKVCCEKVTQEAARSMALGMQQAFNAVKTQNAVAINVITGFQLSDAASAFGAGLHGIGKAASVWAALANAVAMRESLDDPKIQLVLGPQLRDPLAEALDGLNARFAELSQMLKDMHDGCLGCCRAGDYELPACDDSWEWIRSREGNGLEAHPGGEDERFRPLNRKHPRGLL